MEGGIINMDKSKYIICEATKFCNIDGGPCRKQYPHLNSHWRRSYIDMGCYEYSGYYPMRMVKMDKKKYPTFETWKLNKDSELQKKSIFNSVSNEGPYPDLGVYLNHAIGRRWYGGDST
jgi:hypothetical protein